MPDPNVRRRAVDNLAEQALLADEPLEVPEAPAPDPTPAADASPASAPTPSTPAERWREAIKQAGMDEEKANRILDAFVSPGYYQEEFALLNGRVRVTLRSYEVENRMRIQRAVDRLSNPTMASIQETSALYALVGGVWKFWRKGMAAPVVLPFPEHGTPAEKAAEMFDKRMTYVKDSGEIGGPVMDVLYQVSARFNAQLWAALSEGAAQGF